MSVSRGAEQIVGLLMGQVIDNLDPDGQCRVKVAVPTRGGSWELPWAPLVSPMAGPEWGQYFMPEVGAQVLVAFEGGDAESPVVIGSLWTGKARGPALTPAQRKGNDVREIRTRSGHLLRFDDTDGAEEITLADKTGKNLLAIRSLDSSIELRCEGVLTLAGAGGITLDAGTGDVKLTGQNLSVEAAAALTARAGSSLGLEARVEATLSAGETSTLRADAQGLLLNGARVSVNDGALEVV